MRDDVNHAGNGVAFGCHTLGFKTKFIDFIGDDQQGELILERYRQTGLDFSYLLDCRRWCELTSRAGQR